MVALTHIQDFLEHQVSGINIRVGIKIFSIVVSLGCGYGRFREFLKFLLGVLGQYPLRKLKILGELVGRLL